MATFAKVALNGAVHGAAAREHEGFRLSIKRVEAHELLDYVRTRGRSRRRELRVLLCAADHTDSHDLRNVLEQVGSVRRIETRVLDYGYNAKVADVTKTLHVGYQPYATKPQQMNWVEETIHTVWPS
jgi:hypothetical protein